MNLSTTFSKVWINYHSIHAHIVTIIRLTTQHGKIMHSRLKILSQTGIETIYLHNLCCTEGTYVQKLTDDDHDVTVFISVWKI
jgi:radical SAM superfamily enzyme